MKARFVKYRMNAIWILTSVLIVIAAAFLGVTYSHAQKVLSYVSESNWSASKEYSTYVNDSFVQKRLLISGARRRLDKLNEELAKEKIHAQSALSFASDLKKLDNLELTKLATRYLNSMQIYVNARSAVSEGQYLEALEELSALDADAPNIKQVKKLMASIKTPLLKELDNIIAAAAADSDEWVSAFTAVKMAKELFPQDKAFSQRYQTIYSLFLKQVTAKASALETAHHYYAAERVLKQALDVLPDDKQLSKQLTALQKKPQPDTLLSVLYSSNSTGSYKVSPGAIDVNGNCYSGANTYIIDSNSLYRNTRVMIIQLNGEYSRLNGIIAVSNGNKAGDEQFGFYICSGDESDPSAVLFDTGAMKRSAEPIEVDVPLDGVETISCFIKCSSSWAYLILSEFEFYK